ncbi:N-acetylmuramoyl-L-alanine amidase CwlD [Clostridium sp. DL1XJH146]
MDKLKNILVFTILLIIFNSLLCVLALGDMKFDRREKIILIDPGHGGVDGGAVSKKGTLEKELNLKIALNLKNKLEELGYKCVMTRDDDYGLYSDKGKIRDKKIEDLNNRCKLKKDSNCDIFVSIHLNMFDKPQYSGAQVWYAKQPQEAAELAHIIQVNLKNDLDNNNNRKEKCANDAYKILRCHNSVPSVIVECGFLSNQIEEEKLLQEEYQYMIAQTLARSIDDYFIMHTEEEKKEEIQEVDKDLLDKYQEEHWN